MRKVVPVLVAAVGLLVSAATAEAAGNVQFFIGQRYLDSSVWAPVERPQMFGFQVDFAPTESPVHVALGSSLATDSSSQASAYFNRPNLQATFTEFSAGFVWLPVRKAFVRPYLGAGVLTMSAGLDDDDGGWIFGGEHDRSFGYYGSAGVYFKVGDSFNIGIDGRIVRGTRFDLSAFRVEGDYEQASLLMGFSWGGPEKPKAKPVVKEEDDVDEDDDVDEYEEDEEDD